MNDLINRRALREALSAESGRPLGAGWVDRRTLSMCLALLDAAPTVSCEECEYGRFVNTWAEEIRCYECYCGDCFERRQA